MGKKITEYPNNVSTNPDDLSLMDLSEKTGLSTFESRKWTLTAFKAWVNSWVVAGSVAWNNITGKPDVTIGSGNQGKIAKWSSYGGAPTFELSNSIIEQNQNNCVGIPSATDGVQFSLVSGQGTTINTLNYSNNTNTFGIAITAGQGQNNFGLYVTANSGGTTKNVALYGRAYNATINIGIHTDVTAGVGGEAYCAQLQDGTEEVGKFLKNVASNGKANWAYIPKVRQYAISDETTALTLGTKLTARMPYAMTITGVRASLTTAQTSGNIITFDVKKNGTTIFIANWLTIDNNEKTSVTADLQPILNITSLADDDELTFEITQIGNGTAKGAKITLIGY